MQQSTSRYVAYLNSAVTSVQSRYRLPADALNRRLPPTPAIRARGTPEGGVSLYQLIQSRDIKRLPAYLTLTEQLGQPGNGIAPGLTVMSGAVQVTMIVAGFYNGERPSAVEGIGLVIASLGLVYLVSPGLSALEPAGAAMMTVARVAWGGYSLRGRVSGDPVRATGSNFLCVTPVGVCARDALARPDNVVDLLLLLGEYWPYLTKSSAPVQNWCGRHPPSARYARAYWCSATSRSRSPAVVVIGGLISSTTLTLILYRRFGLAVVATPDDIEPDLPADVALASGGKE